MKVRVVKAHELYYGEVYGMWIDFRGKHLGWKRVTGPCFTEWGAKRELEKWKKENCPKVFEI